MATTVHEPPQIARRLPDEGQSGNSGGWNLVPAEGNLRPPARYASTGLGSQRIAAGNELLAALGDLRAQPRPGDNRL